MLKGALKNRKTRGAGVVVGVLAVLGGVVGTLRLRKVLKDRAAAKEAEVVETAPAEEVTDQGASDKE